MFECSREPILPGIMGNLCSKDVLQIKAKGHETGVDIV